MILTILTSWHGSRSNVIRRPTRIRHAGARPARPVECVSKKSAYCTNDSSRSRHEWSGRCCNCQDVILGVEPPNVWRTEKASAVVSVLPRKVFGPDYPIVGEFELWIPRCCSRLVKDSVCAVCAHKPHFPGVQDIPDWITEEDQRPPRLSAAERNAVCKAWIRDAETAWRERKDAEGSAAEVLEPRKAEELIYITTQQPPKWSENRRCHVCGAFNGQSYRIADKVKTAPCRVGADLLCDRKRCQDARNLAVHTKLKFYLNPEPTAKDEKTEPTKEEQWRAYGDREAYVSDNPVDLAPRSVRACISDDFNAVPISLVSFGGSMASVEIKMARSTLAVMSPHLDCRDVRTNN